MNYVVDFCCEDNSYTIRVFDDKVEAVSLYRFLRDQDNIKRVSIWKL